MSEREPAMFRGRLAACEWGKDSTLLTYRVPNVFEVSMHGALIIPVDDNVCPYHRESFGWDACSEDYEGVCVVEAIKKAYRDYHG